MSISTSSTTTRSLCADLTHAEPGETVRLQGWVHRRRALARITFLVVRDRTGLAQVVLPAGSDVPPEETTVEVTGTATANPQAPGGVEVTEATVVRADRRRRDAAVRALAARAQRRAPDAARPRPGGLAAPGPAGEVGAGRGEPRAASGATLDGLGFTEIQTPKFVESATESGANVFEVDYFGRPAYLAQSPQFYKQQMVGVFERVYEAGPVFRAEPHDTVRHLAEYVSLDVELGFIDDHRDVLAVLRDVLAGMVERAAAASPSAPARRCRRCPTRSRWCTSPRRWRIVGAPADEPDLAPEHERALGAWALEKHGSDFLAVEGYPMVKRPFYTHPQPSDPRWSNSFDLLFRGPGAGHRRAAAAPAGRLRAGAPGPRRGPGGVRGVPPGLPARHAPARRLRHRPRALGRPPGRGHQHPRGHPLPPRPAPPDALTR